jgi:hypothetical protein
LLPTFVRLASTLIVLLTLLVAAVLAIGGTQPLHPTLRGFVEGCEEIPQPCWYGINLDTSENDNLILENLGFTVSNTEFRSELNWTEFEPSRAGFCRVRITRDRDYGKFVSLNNCSDILLGNLIAAVGAPTTVMFSGDVATVKFGDGSLWGAVVLTPSQNWLSPSSRVFAILLDPMILMGGPPPFEWRGFLPRWRYCQFQPDFCY